MDRHNIDNVLEGNDLIVDWPSTESKPKRVTFALKHNSSHPSAKNSQERRLTWYSREEKGQFKNNALRDAEFFRRLRNSTKKIDPFVYEERACAWGLEKAIFVTEAHDSKEKRKALVRSVLGIHERSYHDNLSDIEEEVSTLSKQFSEAAVLKARKIGILHENAVSTAK